MVFHILASTWYHQKLKKQQLIEIQFIYYRIHPFKMCKCNGFSIFTNICNTITTDNFRTLHHIKKESYTHEVFIYHLPFLLSTPSHFSTLSNYQSTLYLHIFAYSGHLIQIKSFNMLFSFTLCNVSEVYPRCSMCHYFIYFLWSNYVPLGLYPNFCKCELCYCELLCTSACVHICFHFS